MSRRGIGQNLGVAPFNTGSVAGSMAPYVGAVTGNVIPYPASLALSGWWQASFTAAPWVGVASAGTSGSNNLVTDTADPSSGTALNGLNPATFNGTTQRLIATGTSGGLAKFITTTAYRISMLVNITTEDAPSAHPYTDRGILGSDGGNWGVTATTSGVSVFQTDGAYKSASKACATAGWHAVDIVYDGINMTVSVDAVAGTPVACGALTTTTGSFCIGTNFSKAVFYAGSVAECMISKTTLSAVTAADFKSYYNLRYGLSL